MITRQYSMSSVQLKVMLRTAYSYKEDAGVPEFDDDGPIVIFDGECVMCSGWAMFVLNRDRAGRFRFLAAQSPLGQALYRHFGLNPTEFDTNILLHEGRPYLKSDAAVKTLALMGLPWSAGTVLRVVPRPVRNFFYDMIARNRMRVAGRRETCYVPTPDQASRFLR